VNGYLIGAALVAITGGALHSALGERLILSRLDAATLPAPIGTGDFTLRVLRLFWHLVSVAWWGLSAVLWRLGQSPSVPGWERLAGVIGVTFLASAIVAFVVSRGKHFSWGVLLTVAIFVGLGVVLG